MLIGISGKARSGKDLLFSFAQKEGYAKRSFAEALKWQVRENFKLTDDHVDGWLKDAACEQLQDHSPRELLIEMGNLYRKYDDSYWVKKAFEGLDTSKDWMFTDVRYWNEAEAIRNHGGILLRLERHPSRDSLVSTEVQTSISETALDNYKRFDFTLQADENKTPEQLAAFWNLVSATLHLHL